MNSAVMMFERTAAMYPQRTAVTDEAGDLSFSRLRAGARAAATALLRDGSDLGRICPVIVYLPRSAAALTCFLGAMYAGDPYVPVDYGIPMARLSSIVASMEQCRIITDKAGAEKLALSDMSRVRLHILDDMLLCQPDDEAIDARVAGVIDSDLIYIMFTSGSTGVPKGVTIPHRGIIDFALWLRDTFHFDENTVLGSQSAFHFDNSTLDIFTMCLTGAHLRLIPDVLFRYPSQLMDFVAENKVNSIFWVPTVMISVANAGALDGRELPELKVVLFAGEAMPNKQLNIWRKSLPAPLYGNLYGTTEITDICTYYIADREFADSDPLPIGKACRNMRAVILREDGSECAVGETGELCIGGSGLSRGYWNSPEQTRAAFIQNPQCKYYDDILYRTGDLSYFAPDGNIMFIGRADSQIKRRGIRIEPGDIETAAMAQPGIQNACVLFEAESQDIVLVAQTSEKLVLRKLNIELKKLLPKYMTPTRLVCMEELPLTPSGKIDRQRLTRMIKEIQE